MTNYSDAPEIQSDLLDQIAYSAAQIDAQDDLKQILRLSTPVAAKKLISKIYSVMNLKENKFILREQLEDLLTSNCIHYRATSVLKGNRYLEQVPRIMRLLDNDDICLAYEENGKSFYYDPFTDKSVVYSCRQMSDIFESSCYELYPVFPANLTSFKALFLFVFSSIKADLTVALILSLLLSTFGLLSPLITAHVVGDVVPSGDTGWILSTFIVSVLIALYTSAVSWLQSFYLIRVSQKMSLRTEIPLYKRMLCYPLSFVDSYSVGDLSSRIGSISKIVSSLSSSFLTALVQGVSLVTYSFMMFYYDQELAIAAIIFVAIAAAIDVYLIRKQLIYIRNSTELSADLYNTTLQSLGAIAQVRVNGAEPYVLKNWFSKIINISDLGYESARLSDFNSIVSNMVSIAGSSMIYAILITQILRQSDASGFGITASLFIVFSSAYSGFSSSFYTVVGLINNAFGSLLIDWQRASPLVRQGEEQSRQLNCIRLDIAKDFDIRNLSFQYEDSNVQTLDNISCKIVHGKFNVIFGPSGCGKSTLLSLILGFYMPTSGNIFCGDVRLVELDLQYYRSQFGVVMQNSSMPPMSIKDCLTGGLDYDEKQIWDTLELVNISEEISRLPMKLETILSEGAQNISGGQRQRLCIARALLRNPTILLEDESTSALDNFSQKIILNNLRELCITRVVVAHRISAIRGCDHMIVLSRAGTIEAEGTFDECLSRSPFLQAAIAGSSNVNYHYE